MLASYTREEVNAQVPTTGSTCQQSGIYSNDCHAKQIALSKGGDLSAVLTVPPGR